MSSARVATRASRQSLRQVAAEPRPAQLPLSYAQEGLWFLDQFGMGRAAYSVRTLLRLKGPLDRAALARALNAIVARHEPLRTHFPSIDGVPYQVVAPPAPLDLPVEDARRLPPADREARARAISHEERDTPFDLARGPVTRARLLQLDDEDHLLAWTCHHIALDGWSRGVLHRELGALYDAFHAGRDTPLPPLPIHYADVVRWQRADPGGEMARGLEYWTKQLADMPERLALPTDRPRPSVQTFVAGVHELIVASDVMLHLRQITAAARATLYMSMLTALAILLARYSGQADIIVGSTIANRQDPDVELLIGLFVNRLVMRVRLQRDLTFRQLLASVRQTTLEAYRHQNVPFERIVEALAPQRRVDMTPLVQVSFAFQNAPWVVPQLAQLDTTFAIEPLLVRTDLELHAFERSGSFHLGWIYNEDLFDRPRIEQMARHYVRLLTELAANPDAVIDHLSLLDPSERHTILTAWNQTDAPCVPATIPELFQREARRRPDAVAVVVGDDHQLTYAGLARQARGIASRLRALGVDPEARVGLCADRSAGMIAGVIGITQVGAAYLPIEPRLPRDRRAALLEAAGAAVLLTDVAVADDWPANVVVVDLDDRQHEQASDADGETSARCPRPAQAAYVLYTSGTTGTPKGVVVQHYQVVNYIDGVCARVPGLGSGARCAMVQPLAVDSSVLMLYSALFNGGRLCLVPSDLATDPVAYPLYSIRHGIEFLKIAPSHLAALETNTAASSLPRHTVIVGGEASPAAWMASLKTTAPCEVFNHYGPTETTVGVVMDRVGPPESIGHTVPIGRPLANVRTYIVDAALEPVPIGVAGELLIAGTNVARGYLHQPALTAARFVADPFGPAGSRVYRTGDFARWRADGAIEFLGRTDDQVKIRGFRVELGEIETILRQSRDVQGAMVLLRGERSDAQLVAYVVRRPSEVDRVVAADDEALGRRLLGALRKKLPDYMVPSAVVVLRAWPLTRHGKVDRARLPVPDRPFVTAAGREPRTPEEEILCELVADVLGLPHVGVDDDFFALGGHSLLATRLVSRIHALLDDQVPIRAVFETPTVAGLAHHLHGARGSRPPLRAAPRTGLVPASFAQQRLCFHDQFAGGSAEYNLSRVLRVRGRLDRDALARALNAIVARHEPLRTCFKVVDGVPFQEVAEPSELELRIEDLRMHPAAEREERAQDRVRAERERPFDLWRGPVVRASLLRLADDDHVLVWICHHVASDGWSRGVFHRELTALYDAFHGGRDDPLPPLPVQYTDFVQWQRAWLGDGTLDEGLAYWTRQLADLPEPLMLPTDRPRPSVQTVSAGHHSMTIAAEQLGALKQVGQSHRSTLYMVLLTGLAVLLARYTDRHDIVVGSPVANRQDAQLEHLIGLLVNSLVMRVRVPIGATFARLLADVRRITLEAYRHQDTPFERIVEALQPERALNVTPLFQVLLVVQNTPSAPVALADLDVEPIFVEATRVRYDLEIHVQEHEGALVVYWAYNRDLFDHWRIEQMAAHYTQILETMAARPSSKVDELTLAAVDGAAVRHDVAPVHGWLPTVTALFDEQAARTPDAIAVACGDVAITYGEARARVQRVARRLVVRGIQPGDIVATLLERSELVPIVMLGIFQAGAIYAPIDSRQPAHRLRAVLDAARPALLLRTGSTTAVDGFPDVLVDALMPSNVRVSETGARTDREPSASEAAYVMYTSGSSGTPNGVIVSHASLTMSLGGMRDCLPLGRGDRQLASTTFTFDPSLVEILLPLCHGASVIMARSEDVATPADLCALIRRSQATSIQATPSYWNVLLEHDAGAFRGCHAFSGGEPLTGDLARALADAAAVVHNLYGPTETTMWATAHRVGDGDLAAATLPIGRALTGYRLSVLDSALRVVPPGVPGEIYIGGDGLAFGYLGRPEFSACRFVASVDGVESGHRMYRTGDIAMCRPDGALQFLGRRDTQVKMRGVRIELGEVEAAVRREAAVRDAVVLVRGEGSTRHLVAYVERAAVLRGGALAPPREADDLDETAFSDRLLDALRHVLPDYMVPAAIVVMPQWPLTATGKINRRVLPEPVLPAHGRDGDVAATPEEEALCELFAQVLGLPRVGVNDDFFALGGHSLLAMRLVTRLCARLGVNVPLRTVFDSPTVAGLATWLAAR